MRFEALGQLDNEPDRVERFDSIVRRGPWQLATFEGLLARNPMPFAAVLVHDDGAALADAHNRISDEGKMLAVIAYATKVEPDTVVDAMHAGAIDYLTWPFDPAGLAERLQITAGRAARRLRERRIMRHARSKFADLSGREREVLAELTTGASNKEMAQRLGISPRTVEIHRANMLGKIGAHTSIEAAVWATEANLFSEFARLAGAIATAPAHSARPATNAPPIA